MTIINRIITAFAGVLLLVSQLHAMQAMNESELAATYGQAIFEVSENIVQQENGSELNMLRITMGAHIEINANVDELALGRYWRPEGTKDWEEMFERDKDNFETFSVYGRDPNHENHFIVAAHNGHDKVGIWSFDAKSKSFIGSQAPHARHLRS